MNQELSAFISQLAASLDPGARGEFTEIEKMMLAKYMSLCGMIRYPFVRGNPDGERACGDVVCTICHNKYRMHPLDWRVIGYGNRPFLNVLCDGHRVKL